MKKNPHVGSTIEEAIVEREAREPGFATAVQSEFDKLQIARKVRAAREKRKLTQTELADRVGTTRSAVARLESGRVVPKLDLLERISHALGMKLRVDFVEAKGR